MDKWPKILALITAYLLLNLLAGCISQGEEIIFEDVFVVDPPPSSQVIDGLCYTDTYNLPEEFITRELDILIVPDTSGSINAERAEIVDGFDHFIDALPIAVNFNIGVVLAHGSHSNFSGELYQKSSEPLVIRSSDYNVDDIKSYLNDKMVNPSIDNHSDGGELGIYSLLQALQEDQVENFKAQGMFREDAALVVIFVADEQDICAEFPVGVQPVIDPQGKEDASYLEDCVDAQGERIITEESLVARLQEIKGDMPLVIGGILYNNLNTIPLHGENELGYGYLKAIQLAGGISVDLATGEYGDGLNQLGTLATTSLQPINDFNLATSNIDETTLAVTVNGTPVAFTYDSSLNQLHLVEDRDPFSEAIVKYCENDVVAKVATQIVTGGQHSCALLLDGNVKCWGANNYGQLGLGHTVNIGDDESIATLPTVEVGGTVIQLSAGLQHTCALLDDNSVKCWGRNSFGQLGQGNTDDIGDDEHPSSINSISLGQTAKKIFSGTLYNCAILQTGDVRCWGDNVNGQLGLGHTDDIGDDEVPSSEPVVNIGGTVVKMDISTISSHSCAILQNGNVRCWGQNTYGQLGYGHTNNIGDDEDPVTAGNVSIGAPAIQLATGNRHTCALLDNQSVKCWGDGSFGQLGNADIGVYGDDELPSSLPSINIGSSVKQIATGNFSSCAITLNDNLLCWGQGSFGKLGYGNTENIGDDELPATVGTVAIGHAIDMVAAGINHTCVLTKVTGEPLCWGQGSLGQLGQAATDTIGDDELPSDMPLILLE